MDWSLKDWSLILPGERVEEMWEARSNCYLLKEKGDEKIGISSRRCEDIVLGLELVFQELKYSSFLTLLSALNAKFA